MRSKLGRYGVGTIAILASIVVFIVPFIFIFLTAVKTRAEANELKFSWPTEWAFFQNLQTVWKSNDYQLRTAFINSIILTVVSVAILVVLGAMCAYVLQRRKSKWNVPINLLVLSGLIIPPAVVPTIWVLQGLGLFKTLPGLILVEVAFGLSFSILLFRAFISSIPVALDEAAWIDGCGSITLFFKVIFPLLRPVIVTVVVVMSVNIFNDFTNPLYFLPGDKNATVQLTLFNFQSQFSTDYNLLFTNVLLITVLPLIMYMFFSRQITAGMTSGAVKG
jgi:raffinose/stachyose/melibiose transport system permease protein